MLFKIQLIALAALLPQVLGQTRKNGQACSDDSYVEIDPLFYFSGNRVIVALDQALSPGGFSHDFGGGVIGTVHYEHVNDKDGNGYSLHVSLHNPTGFRKTLQLGSFYDRDPKDPNQAPSYAVGVSANSHADNDDCLVVGDGIVTDQGHSFTLQTV